jgi:adenosylcobinamide kinase / adenosylcobinamide-phosphate guanylyltransferase
MSLVVITGGARSGKSRAAQQLVSAKYEAATVVVSVHALDDHEMLRRIDRHKAARPTGFHVVEAHEGMSWTSEVPVDACLLLDCLGTLLGLIIGAAFGADAEQPRADDLVGSEVEELVEAGAGALVEWLIARDADTVVVTNEVGSGVVPSYPDARLFRDVLGAANRTLTEASDAAYLAVAGRLIDLKALPREAAWPGEE